MKERPVLFSCLGCRSALPRTLEFFGKASKARDGMRTKCKPCISEVKKDHYRRTREAQRERQIKYQRENRERLYAYNAKWARERHQALRVELIAAYGGACNCCGEREPIFLDLDHVHNDGAKDRQQGLSTTSVMLKLRAAGWPKGRHQLLCSNCNQGKARNGGVCPHQHQEARCA